MLVRVIKHGNSLSVRLGAYFTRTAGIRAGDLVDLFMLPCGEIRIKPQGTPPVDTAEDTAGVDRKREPAEAKW